MLLNKVLFFKILFLSQKNYENLPLVVVFVRVIFVLVLITNILNHTGVGKIHAH